MNVFWAMLNAFQIMGTLAIINTKFPVNAMITYSMVQTIASFEILPSSLVLFYMQFDEDEPVFNENFEELGFEYRNLVGNSGSVFVFA